MVAWCANHAPKWNPINVCSYHLQEAGATPVQEIAYALATAIGVLDAVRDSGQVAPSSSRRCSARSRSSSTPASASSRRSASCGPSPSCGIASASSATASPTPRPRRFRYGVQVNSLGLTEAQPENNVQRIVLEMLGGHAVEAGPGALDPAAGVERGARPAASVGPAVVVAHATGAGVRDRPARVRRPASTARRSSRSKTAELRRRAPGPSSTTCSHLGGVVRGDRRAEGSTRALDGRAHPAHRDRASSRWSGSTASPRPRRRRSASRATSSRSIRRSRPRRSPTCAPGVPDATSAAVAQALDELRNAAADGRPTSWARSIELAQRRRHHRRVGRGVARRVRRVPRPDRRVGAAVGRTQWRVCRAVAERVQVDGGGPAAVPGRQARPRRPLQRRRADRGGGPRRRHGGRVLGHPPHTRADRRVGARRGPRRDRPVDPQSARHLELVPAIVRSLACRKASTPRSSSAGSSPRTTGRR